MCKQHIGKPVTVNQVVAFSLILMLLFSGGCASQPEELSQTTPIPEDDTAEVEAFDGYAEERARLTAHAVRTQDLQDKDVIRALGSVPRHRFVPEEIVDSAYHDTALPIGYGQTISQPTLVALMTELLDLDPGDKVLEIGTGSGYQAAIMAELGYVEVYTIEIVPELYERATAILGELGYSDVYTKQGDGYYGWEAYAPYDAIIVTAAPDHMPAPLADQLAEGGVMVIPIGPQGYYQTMWKFINQDGELTAYDMGYVAFVPFTGEGVEGP
jgi:protein-L-isoaspartate(D-aspartate) O-methyltransferase